MILNSVPLNLQPLKVIKRRTVMPHFTNNFKNTLKTILNEQVRGKKPRKIGPHHPCLNREIFIFMSLEIEYCKLVLSGEYKTWRNSSC